ncbi:hypothetical protein K6959_01610 [Bacillus aquiflavi]|uniref:hypothetical protein n=1 Tax=Bacillus aquiflavi TaxID=2672567 RepID=UPI001CA98D38|nr:hypothetical protein [Bacillus aquiflavi]UAC48705.1 hypothetical protein K6959_01610 [Bacillus aquiflavi]
MKRDLQINYGILDDMIGQLHMYKHALVKMKDSLGSSFHSDSNESGEKCRGMGSKDQSFPGKNRKIRNTNQRSFVIIRKLCAADTTVYISPIARNAMMRVDRNDIWINLTQIESGITRNVTKALNRSFETPSSILSLFDDPTDAEKKASEINRRNMEKIQASIKSTRNKLQNKMDDLWELYDMKVKKFENVDDAYHDRAAK